MSSNIYLLTSFMNVFLAGGTAFMMAFYRRKLIQKIDMG